MSRENVELAHTSIDLFNHRDLSGLAEHSHSDFEFVSVLTAVDTGGATFRGPQAWTSYFATMDEAWEDWRAGRPAIIDEAILPALSKWARGAAVCKAFNQTSWAAAACRA